MVKIYALVSGQLVLYVGRTNNMKQRENYHRGAYNKCHSKYIPSYIDWNIKLLEEVQDNIGKIKEQYYYDTLKPLYNKCRPNTTNKEAVKKYTNSNRETIRKKVKTICLLKEKSLDCQK